MEKIGEANLGVVRIDAFHCYVCNEQFDRERRKTQHHAIPKSLHPKRNIVLPVCDDCHKLINGKTLIPKKSQLMKTVTAMKKDHDRLTGRFDKVLEKLEK